jgi:hypothetical protein
MATTRKRLEEVSVQALDPARLEPLIGEQRMQRFEVAAERTRRLRTSPCRPATSG